jgi:UDP-glucose 4-epimerase
MSAPDAVGRVLNVACGEPITVNGVLVELERLTRRRLEPAHAAARPGEVRHSEADITRAREVLGYRPRIRFKEGLARTVEHFRTGPRSE